MVYIIASSCTGMPSRSKGESRRSVPSVMAMGEVVSENMTPAIMRANTLKAMTALWARAVSWMAKGPM